MKLKIYRIYCEPSDCEHCSAIAFYIEEEEIDTDEVFECQ